MKEQTFEDVKREYDRTFQYPHELQGIALFEHRAELAKRMIEIDERQKSEEKGAVKNEKVD